VLPRTHTKIVFTTSTRAMKTTRLPTLILAAILSGSALGQPYDITELSKPITASEGELVEIVCPSSNKITNCIFRSPVGATYFINDGEQYENERIVTSERTDNRCGMRIRNLSENDNGLWECTLGLKNPDTKISSTMKKTFELEIAVHPESVMLNEQGGSSNIQELSVVKEENGANEAKLIDCVAAAARPKPTFSWFIGEEELNAEVTEREENEKDKKKDYISTLSYYPVKNHHGKTLRCEVKHNAYTLSETEKKENQAEATLNVEYAPVPRDKPVQVHDLKIGETAVIPVSVEANPEPNSAEWKWGNETLAAGSSTKDGKLKSSILEKGSIDGQWRIELSINNLAEEDTKQPYYLIVSNSQGKREYIVQVNTGQAPTDNNCLNGDDVKCETKPPVTATNTPIVIGILVIAIVLVVVLLAIARVKGMLCFAAKSSDDSDPEKEAFDNAEKGEKAPIVEAEGGDKPAVDPTAAGDMANNSSPEKKAAPAVVEAESETKDSEDKKSNGGARTPV